MLSATGPSSISPFSTGRSLPARNDQTSQVSEDTPELSYLSDMGIARAHGRASNDDRFAPLIEVTLAKESFGLSVAKWAIRAMITTLTLAEPWHGFASVLIVSGPVQTVLARAGL